MSNEWYIPGWLIKAATEVLGAIDLDPASCALANETVKAARYFTEADNGLAQPWYGRVWLNPPFGVTGVPWRSAWQGQSVAGLWIEKLLAAYQAGDVTAAILLAKADPKQRWFQPLMDYALCFAGERVKFDRPGLPHETFQFGTALIYFGPAQPRFIEVFRKIGDIYPAGSVIRMQR